jgi:alkaline phosphatase
VVATTKSNSNNNVVIPKHKNLIFMVGDGYGPASVTLGRTCKGEDLYIEKYLKGMVRTRSAESVVTDSAAAATTYSCGLRTYNAAIAVDNDEKPCGTVFEAAKAKGMAIGAVVTSRVTHATPAAFTSHAVERDDEDFIAKQQLEKGLDVFMGGGRAFFTASGRPDKEDLIQHAKDLGYTVLQTYNDFAQYSGDGPVLGLFADSHMSYEIDRVREEANSSLYQPSLADMTRVALRILSKKGGDKGFMLLVEGSRIDHAGHDNDPASHLRDILSFDAAAKVCIDYAEAAKDTLIVATADHETGGMTLSLQPDINQPYQYIWYPDVIKRVNASAEYMAAQILTQNRTAEELIRTYSIPDVTQSELDYVQQFVNTTREKLVWALGKIVANRALIGYTTHGHSGVDVDYYVYSPYALNNAPTGSVENFALGLFFAQEFNLDLAAITRELSTFNPRPHANK